MVNLVFVMTWFSECHFDAAEYNKKKNKNKNIVC